MYYEENYIHINALQHYVFCPRQCALIYLEDLWQENLYTVRGNLLHEKVDSDSYESRGAVKTVRGLRIHSRQLGLTGRCDVVEFRKPPGGKGDLQVVPVEFKAGKPKQDISDKAQLCAQALCLEEMLNISVRRGVFFYGRIRRRVPVDLDDTLRKQTEQLIVKVHQLLQREQVPTLPEVAREMNISAATFMKRCRNCSLQSACQPKAMNERKLKNYLKNLFEI